MSLINYIKDNILSLLIRFFTFSIIIVLLFIFNCNNFLIALIITFLCLNFIIIFLNDFIKRKKFYNNFKSSLDNLDKKYLITEMITKSDFIDGKLFLDYLYEIDKSMHEEINTYKYINNEFKEYIELWCHEIKTPIATSKLIIENNNNEITKSILEEIENIESYVEQVLYYSRSDAVEKDYIITKVDLNKVINYVIRKNKKEFISKKIKVDISNVGYVNSDSKWLIFILNQIIINSIKYSKSKNPIIKILYINNKNNSVLSIYDNGIGIEKEDIDKVFDKGFTGKNGRLIHSSTGIGLYLCKKLCNKLGYNIIIESNLNEFTKVSIVFPKSSMITK